MNEHLKYPLSAIFVIGILYIGYAGFQEVKQYWYLIGIVVMMSFVFAFITLMGVMLHVAWKSYHYVERKPVKRVSSPRVTKTGGTN